jgi:hypothetical protein
MLKCRGGGEVRLQSDLKFNIAGKKNDETINFVFALSMHTTISTHHTPPLSPQRHHDNRHTI